MITISSSKQDIHVRNAIDKNMLSNEKLSHDIRERARKRSVGSYLQWKSIPDPIASRFSQSSLLQ